MFCHITTQLNMVLFTSVGFVGFGWKRSFAKQCFCMRLLVIYGGRCCECVFLVAAFSRLSFTHIHSLANTQTQWTEVHCLGAMINGPITTDLFFSFKAVAFFADFVFVWCASWLCPCMNACVLYDYSCWMVKRIANVFPLFIATGTARVTHTFKKIFAHQAIVYRTPSRTAVLVWIVAITHLL